MLYTNLAEKMFANPVQVQTTSQTLQYELTSWVHNFMVQRNDIHVWSLSFISSFEPSFCLYREIPVVPHRPILHCLDKCANLKIEVTELDFIPEHWFCQQTFVLRAT